jgi:hypothetical protein
MYAMLEKQLEQKLKKEVEKLGGLALKLTCPGFTGIPDRLVILPNGEIHFVEMKSEGQKMRPRQEYVKRQLETLNQKVIVLDSLESIKKYIDDIQT